MRKRLFGLSDASAQRRHASAVRCNRLLAGQTYFNRFIGGAIHLPSSASAFGQQSRRTMEIGPCGAGIGGSHNNDLLWSALWAGDGIRQFIAAIQDGWAGAIHAHEEIPTFTHVQPVGHIAACFL